MRLLSPRDCVEDVDITGARGLAHDIWGTIHHAGDRRKVQHRFIKKVGWDGGLEERFGQEGSKQPRSIIVLGQGSVEVILVGNLGTNNLQSSVIARFRLCGLGTLTPANSRFLALRVS